MHFDIYITYLHVKNTWIDQYRKWEINIVNILLLIFIY